jgi:hypothetical protein
MVPGTNGEVEVVIPPIRWQIRAPDVTFHERFRKGSKVEEIHFQVLEEVVEVKEMRFPGGSTARV